MIDLQETTITCIGKDIALTNTASFLWRKLTNSPTVTYLSQSASSIDLIESLKELVAKPKLTEAEQTAAYIFLIAILLQNNNNSIILKTLPGIDALYWFKSLLKFIQRAHYDTSITPMAQGLIDPKHFKVTRSLSEREYSTTSETVKIQGPLYKKKDEATISSSTNVIFSTMGGK